MEHFMHKLQLPLTILNIILLYKQNGKKIIEDKIFNNALTSLCVSWLNFSFHENSCGNKSRRN